MLCSSLFVCPWTMERMPILKWVEKWGERRVAFFASNRDFKFWVWNEGNVGKI
jgi:hypothetical protein